jgi:hypothetical protein
MENHDDATNDKNFSGPKHSPNDSPGEVSESGAKQKPKPPISERKLVANRLNARRSTGPKTPEGKQRSAQNSFKSGIFVRQLFLNTDSGRKEWQAYEDVATGIYEHYQPVSIMEEMLVDKVVSAAVRSARVLWFETAAFARNDTFWGQAVDKVLRYQTATDRQLTKAIELLEDVQGKRKHAKSRGETDSGSESSGVPKNPCDMPWAPGSGDQERLAPEPPNLSETNQVSGELSSEAIARRWWALTFGAVSPEREEHFADAPREMTNYKTKPPTPDSCEAADATSHEKARQQHSLTKIAEQVAGLAPSPESNNKPVPTLSSGNNAPDATVPGPTQDEIMDCL